VESALHAAQRDGINAVVCLDEARARWQIISTSEELLGKVVEAQKGGLMITI
jgi:hypothetical protein